MIRRFQIEDLLAQDEHGVVFRAEDTETGRQVAVRRIFPFGVDGGGLNEEQRAAYAIAIQRFAKVHHAGLRSVVAGGVDPVDGMPFLATEWVEGPTLARALSERPVAAASVVALMDRVLEVSAALSEIFAEEAVWVETSPSAIVISSADSERGFTFWISPLRWLNETDGRRGLMPVVKLYKAATAHPDPRDDARVVTDLKRWAAWLEKHAEKLTVQQARQGLRDRLMAESGITPAAPLPAPGPSHVSKAAPVVKPAGVSKSAHTKPMPTGRGGAAGGRPLQKKKKSLVPLVTVSLVALCLGAAGFQGWKYYQAKQGVPVAVAAETNSTQSAFDLVNKPKAPAASDAASTLPGPSALATGVPGAKTIHNAPETPPATPAAKPPGQYAAQPPQKASHSTDPKAPTIPSEILGTWSYTGSDGKPYTRTFTAAGECVLKQESETRWTGKVTEVKGDTVTVEVSKGNRQPHVLSKDKKTLEIDRKFKGVRQ